MLLLLIYDNLFVKPLSMQYFPSSELGSLTFATVLDVSMLYKMVLNVLDCPWNSVDSDWRRDNFTLPVELISYVQAAMTKCRRYDSLFRESGIHLTLNHDTETSTFRVKNWLNQRPSQHLITERPFPKTTCHTRIFQQAGILPDTDIYECHCENVSQTKH